MYTRYFGFSEKPFTLTPNPRFIFLSKSHKEAFAHLLYGVNSHHGFIELTGEVGSGKTTVLRALLGQLQDERHRCALVFNPCMTAVDLLRSINQEFNIDASGNCVNDLLGNLNNFLLAENRLNRTVVLVIDEAQNLLPDVLEYLRLISNLETENDKLIQIILAGQPELENILQQRSLRQLNQRIAVRYALKPMSSAETLSYIKHRINIAGVTTGVYFTYSACSLIHLYTRGIPRLINILSDRALLIAYGDERRTISYGIIIRAIGELAGIPTRRRFKTTALITAMLCISAIVSVKFLPTGRPLNQRTHAKPAPSLPQPEEMARPPLMGIPRKASFSATLPQRNRQLRQELSNHDITDTHIQAFDALMSRWNCRHIKLFKGTLAASPETFSNLASKRGLRCTVVKGSLDDMIRFNFPFLAETNVPAKSGKFCLAVTEVTGDSVSISPPLLGKPVVSREDFANLATDTYYLFWKKPARIPDTTIRSEDNRMKLGSVQRLLKQAGYYPGDIDGEYNKSTIKALRDFQQSRGIVANNSMGELTLALLSRFDTNQTAPALTRN